MRKLLRILKCKSIFYTNTYEKGNFLRKYNFEKLTYDETETLTRTVTEEKRKTFPKTSGPRGGAAAAPASVQYFSPDAQEAAAPHPLGAHAT